VHIIHGSKGKGKLSHYHHENDMGERNSSYSLLTLALHEGEWSASCPGFTPGERRNPPQYPLDGRIGGVVVSVLATGPKVCRFELSQGNGFLRAIQICSTPSFGWEVKLEVPCHKILQHVKIS
jgi:hypothetical protein